MPSLIIIDEMLLIFSSQPVLFSTLVTITESKIYLNTTWWLFRIIKYYSDSTRVKFDTHHNRFTTYLSNETSCDRWCRDRRGCRDIRRWQALLGACWKSFVSRRRHCLGEGRISTWPNIWGTTDVDWTWRNRLSVGSTQRWRDLLDGSVYGRLLSHLATIATFPLRHIFSFNASVLDWCWNNIVSAVRCNVGRWALNWCILVGLGLGVRHERISCNLSCWRSPFLPQQRASIITASTAGAGLFHPDATTATFDIVDPFSRRCLLCSTKF